MGNNIYLLVLIFVFVSCKQKQDVYMRLTDSEMQPRSTSYDPQDDEDLFFNHPDEYKKQVDSFYSFSRVFKENWHEDSLPVKFKYVFQHKMRLLYFVPRKEPFDVNKKEPRIMTNIQLDSFFANIYRPDDYYSSSNKYYNFYFIIDSNAEKNTYQVQKADIENLLARGIR